MAGKKSRPTSVSITPPSPSIKSGDDRDDEAPLRAAVVSERDIALAKTLEAALERLREIARTGRRSHLSRRDARP